MVQQQIFKGLRVHQAQQVMSVVVASLEVRVLRDHKGHKGLKDHKVLKVM